MSDATGSMTIGRSLTSEVTLQALAEGLRAGSGQVVVRTARGSGDFLLDAGRIAGVKVPAESASLLVRVADDVWFDPEGVEAIRRESLGTGEPELNLLRLWSQCDPETFEECVRQAMRARTLDLLQMASTGALFLPSEPSPREDIYSFELADLLPEVDERLNRLALVEEQEAAATLLCWELLGGVDEALSVALVNLPTKEALISVSHDAELATAPVGILSLFDYEGRSSVEQAFVAEGESVYFLRRLASGDRALLVGCRADVVVGSGLIAVRQAALKIDRLLNRLSSEE